MALNVQFYKVHNHLTNEDIVIPRIVNQQSLDFNALCEYLADGSTVTAADVAAVMKQIESRLPLVLGLNAKVVCSPEGQTFLPKVYGSITQSQIKEKLWNERFRSKATFKRVTKSNTDSTDSSNPAEEGSAATGNGSSSSQTPSNPTLTVIKSGTGSATVTVGGNTVNNGAEVEANKEVSISVTPAAGATPTATLNGNSVALTENDGVYTGSFSMPSANATLSINTGGSSGGSDQN